MGRAGGSTCTDAATALLPVSMTDRVFAPESSLWTTYTARPSGVIVTDCGDFAIGTAAIWVLVAVSTTDRNPLRIGM